MIAKNASAIQIIFGIKQHNDVHLYDENKKTKEFGDEIKYEYKIIL